MKWEARQEWLGKASLGRLTSEQRVGWGREAEQAVSAETLGQLPPGLCEKQQESRVPGIMMNGS